MTTPSRNLKLKAFPRSFRWRVSASFDGLDMLIKTMDLELRDKYYPFYFSSTSCLDSFSCLRVSRFFYFHLPRARLDIESKKLDTYKPCTTKCSPCFASYFHRHFMERLESFTFESVGNIIEHRLLRLTKSQVYKHKLTYRQRIDSAQILNIELIFTPCRVKLIVIYPARALYFASLKAKRHFRGYLEHLQNLGGLNNERDLKITQNKKHAFMNPKSLGVDGGYGESIMRHNFHFLQRHRVLSTRSIFVLRET